MSLLFQTWSRILFEKCLSFPSFWMWFDLLMHFLASTFYAWYILHFWYKSLVLLLLVGMLIATQVSRLKDAMAKIYRQLEVHNCPPNNIYLHYYSFMIPFLLKAGDQGNRGGRFPPPSISFGSSNAPGL